MYYTETPQIHTYIYLINLTYSLVRGGAVCPLLGHTHAATHDIILMPVHTLLLSVGVTHPRSPLHE